jgi:hypothetical protein
MSGCKVATVATGYRALQFLGEEEFRIGQLEVVFAVLGRHFETFKQHAREGDERLLCVYDLPGRLYHIPI